MAISSAIIKFQPAKEDHVRQELAAQAGVSIEAQAPNGDLVIAIEEPDLDQLEAACLTISKISGVLSVDPSYVTIADEAQDT